MSSFNINHNRFFIFMRLKLFFAGVLVALPAIVFTSCSDDDTVYEDPILVLGAGENEVFFYGGTKDFELAIAGDYVSAAVEAPAGWTAVIGDGVLTVTAPEVTDAAKAGSGEIIVTAKGYNEVDASSSFDVRALYQISFEDADDSYLAGPTAYGDNLYNGEYTGYLDSNSGLKFNTTVGGYGFSSGGIAVSRWNDKSTAGYLNQCSVYYGTDNQGDGGADNSKTFAVVYSSAFGGGGYMSFEENKECVIDHLFCTNNTCAALSMMEGDGYAKKMTYDAKDWFKLTFIGENAAGEKTGEVEVYLADFRTADAGGVLTEWTNVSLRELGKVNKVRFEMSSTDNSEWGMNTPSYFCMDNIAVEL